MRPHSECIVLSHKHIDKRKQTPSVSLLFARLEVLYLGGGMLRLDIEWSSGGLFGCPRKRDRIGIYPKGCISRFNQMDISLWDLSLAVYILGVEPHLL